MYFRQVPQLLQKIYPKAIWSSSQDERLRYTFDDGPHPDSTPQLLSILKRQNIKATFFCLGQQVEKFPSLVDQITKAGHQIGCHGYSHLSGWTTDTSEYIENIKKSLALFKTDLFRAPYGKLRHSQNKIITERLGLKVVFWTHMPGDFDEKVDEQLLSKRIVKILNPNPCIVLHDRPCCISKITYALSRL